MLILVYQTVMNTYKETYMYTRKDKACLFGQAWSTQYQPKKLMEFKILSDAFTFVRANLSSGSIPNEEFNVYAMDVVKSQTFLLLTAKRTQSGAITTMIHTVSARTLNPANSPAKPKNANDVWDKVMGKN